mgnify:CR=1 FL=1|tara:strand:+ start:2786 stop:3736 length:951 start_codon:yes stop_codon:yes gene_type:complete
MRLILTCGLFFLLSFSLKAQNSDSGTGFSMLENAPTPSGLALNESVTAIPQGSASIYLNPALLILNASSTIDLGYSSWIEDSDFIFGGANFISGKRAVSIGIYNSRINGIEQRNNPGPSNGDFSISYLSLSGALAYDFDFISLGIAAQYLNEVNAQYKASGYAFNFGAASEFFDSKLKTGISVLNIGKLDELNNQSTALPELLRAGISLDVFEFTPPKNSDLPVLVSISSDYVQPLNERETLQNGEVKNDPYFNFGLRLNFAEVIELSGGFKTGNQAKQISFGVGLVTDLINVNYALVPYRYGFGSLNSIGLQYKF